MKYLSLELHYLLGCWMHKFFSEAICLFLFSKIVLSFLYFFCTKGWIIMSLMLKLKCSLCKLCFNYQSSSFFCQWLSGIIIENILPLRLSIRSVRNFFSSWVERLLYEAIFAKSGVKSDVHIFCSLFSMFYRYLPDFSIYPLKHQLTFATIQIYAKKTFRTCFELSEFCIINYDIKFSWIISSSVFSFTTNYNIGAFFFFIFCKVSYLFNQFYVNLLILGAFSISSIQFLISNQWFYLC